MKTLPASAEELLKILEYRHQVLFGARLDKKPGKFKDKNNRAGNTHFVDCTMVRGTLIKGFEYYNVLNNPFAKAAYIMFMVSEIHPFLDGKARIARVMMTGRKLIAQPSNKQLFTLYSKTD